MTIDDPLEVVMSFGEACNAHDLQGALDLCAVDVVFQGTTPPDGEHLVGHAELRNVWAPIFENSSSHVEVAESIVIGDRVVQRCLYSWGDGHVRAVGLDRDQSGKNAEKLSYVKG